MGHYDVTAIGELLIDLTQICGSYPTLAAIWMIGHNSRQPYIRKAPNSPVHPLTGCSGDCSFSVQFHHGEAL